MQCTAWWLQSIILHRLFECCSENRSQKFSCTVTDVNYTYCGNQYVANHLSIKSCCLFKTNLCQLYFKMEKAMATHSSTLAWKIPWMEEPGRLQSRGLLRVGHDWATSLSLFTFMLWRRKWQPTPVFLPGESQGRRSLVGCRLRGRTEQDTTEVT